MFSTLTPAIDNSVRGSIGGAETRPAQACNEAAIEADQIKFVCRRSDPLLSVIEKCLDNGIGSCFVTDDERILLGRISRDEIARAIVAGNAPADLTSWQPEKISPKASAREPLEAVVDASGRLIDIKLDRCRQLVRISQPDLSHLEFRGLVAAFLSSWISSRGPQIRDFEEAFAAYVGVDYGVAVTSGTAALHLALVALGIGPGDEVIVPDLTFAATINAVFFCGARPVIVDIDSETWTMSPDCVRAAITPRTKAIIPVHLYGRPAAIGPIAELARARGIFVVEDCAEAHGARYAGKNVGQFGDVSCFSFYANKPVTTGEGGMCMTNSASLAAKIRQLRDHGMAANRWYWHETIGYNYRITSLQAALGLAQVSRIAQTLERNDRLLKLYRKHFERVPNAAFPPTASAEYEPITWLVCVQIPAERRATLLDTAAQDGIELRPFFTPLSAMPIYSKFALPCPNSVTIAATGVNLPTSNAIDEAIIEKVARVFRDVLS